MQSTFSRSTYVGSRTGEKNPTEGIPHPGACGTVAVITGIQSALQSLK